MIRLITFLALFWPALLWAQVNPGIWSIAEIGDIHVGMGGNRGSVSNDWVALRTFIYAHTNDGVYNFRVLLSPGDVFEQNTSYYSGKNDFDGSIYAGFYFPVDAANFLYTMHTNGIICIPTPGNHDSDGQPVGAGNNPDGGTIWPCDSSTYLWSNVFPVTWYAGNKNYVTNMTNPDSKNVVFAYTNGTDKFLFANYAWSDTNSADQVLCYSNQTYWVSNLALQYPGHALILIGHYFLSGRMLAETNTYSNSYNNEGPMLNTLASVPNLMLCIAGHTQTMWSGHTTITGADGHPVDVSCFNMQSAQYGNSGNYSNQMSNLSCIRIRTFNGYTRTVTANTYSFIDSGMLTNQDTRLYFGGAMVPTQPNRYRYYIHNWNFPYTMPLRRTLFNVLY